MSEFTVDRIDDQGDRVLLYSDAEPGVHVIASPSQAAGIKPGDRVQYEPGGANFCFLLDDPMDC